MDPFSVSTGCIGLIAAITQLTVQIVSFVSSVRDARRDMEAVSRELISLSLCLEILRDDSAKIKYPDGLRLNLLAVLKNCDIVTKDISKLLEKLSSANIARRIQWTTTGRDDMDKLRSSLESHKSALDIALDLTAILLISAVKEDTEAIRETTTLIEHHTAQIPSIKQDTSQIADLVQEIGSLRLQLSQSQQSDSKAQLLKRFLEQSSEYAESAVDNWEWEDSSFYSRKTPPEKSSTAVEVEAEEVQADATSSSSPAVQTEEQAVKHNASLETHFRGCDDSNGVSAQYESPAPITQTTLNGNRRKLAQEINLGPETESITGNNVEHVSESEQGFCIVEEAEMQAQNIEDNPRKLDSATLISQDSTLNVPRDVDAILPTKSPGSGGKEESPQTGDALVEDANEGPHVLSTKSQYDLDRELCSAITGRTDIEDLYGKTMTSLSMWCVRTTIKTPTEIEKLLIDGADANTKALNLSLLNVELINAQRIEVLRLLLSHGAIASRSPLTSLTLRANTEVIELMLQNGADPEEVVVVHSTNTGSIQRTFTPLFYVARCRTAEFVELFLRYGANVNKSSGADGTALQGAVTRKTTPETFAVVETLLRNGADPNLDVGDEKPLYTAAGRGNVDVVKLLINHGASILEHGGVYGTALACSIREAPEEKQVQMADLLLGANFDAQIDDRHRTPLYLAAGNDRGKLVKFLVDCGAAINARGGPRGSALHSAVWYCNAEAVKALLEAGADVGRTKCGFGPPEIDPDWPEADTDRKEVIALLAGYGWNEKLETLKSEEPGLSQDGMDVPITSITTDTEASQREVLRLQDTRAGVSTSSHEESLVKESLVEESLVEESLVEEALQQIARPRATGQTHLKLTQPEMDALEQEEKRQARQHFASGTGSIGEDESKMLTTGQGKISSARNSQGADDASPINTEGVMGDQMTSKRLDQSLLARRGETSLSKDTTSQPEETEGAQQHSLSRFSVEHNLRAAAIALESSELSRRKRSVSKSIRRTEKAPRHQPLAKWFMLSGNVLPHRN